MSSRAVKPAGPLQPFDVPSSLGCLQRRRFDFNSHPTNALKGLLCCRAGQEDSQLAHARLSAAAKNDADLNANRQGTGFVVTMGADHHGNELFAPVGVLWHHFAARQQVSYVSIIFIDCLALLMILSNWGQNDYLPQATWYI